MNRTDYRPKISVPFTASDLILEIVGATLCVLLLILTAYFYHKLPEKIPIHFGIDGKVDAYGSKFMIWVLSIIPVIIYSGITVMVRFPHTFNYPFKLTERNVLIQYKIAVRLLRIIKTIIVIIFSLIASEVIRIGLGFSPLLGPFLLPGIFILMLGPVGYYFFLAYKTR